IRAGRRRILFTNKHGDRKTLWLGKLSKRLAEEIKTKVESINAAQIAGYSLDNETAEWLGKVGGGPHTKLAKVGMVTPRAPVATVKQVCLAEFMESYIAGRSDVKPRTRIELEACKARLVEFFGKEKPLASITAGDAKDWEIWLKARYARGTIGRTLKR